MPACRRRCEPLQWGGRCERAQVQPAVARRAARSFRSSDSRREPQLRPIRATPSPSRGEEPEERARRGSGAGGARGRPDRLILGFSPPGPAGGNPPELAGASLRPSRLRVIIRLPPLVPPSRLLGPPSLRVPPPRPPRRPPLHRVAVAAPAETEMGRERARRGSSGPAALPALRRLRPRRRRRCLGVPRLRSRS